MSFSSPLINRLPRGFVKRGFLSSDLYNMSAILKYPSTWNADKKGPVVFFAHGAHGERAGQWLSANVAPEIGHLSFTQTRFIPVWRVTRSLL